MQKISNNSDTYKPNKKVQVVVKNKREEDNDGNVFYDTTVTIKVKAGKFNPRPLTFDQEDSIAKWIEEVDFEDPNQTLDLEITGVK